MSVQQNTHAHAIDEESAMVAEETSGGYTGAGLGSPTRYSWLGAPRMQLPANAKQKAPLFRLMNGSATGCSAFDELAAWLCMRATALVSPLRLTALLRTRRSTAFNPCWSQSAPSKYQHQLWKCKGVCAVLGCFSLFCGGANLAWDVDH